MRHSLPALKQVRWGNGVKCDARNSVILETPPFSTQGGVNFSVCILLSLLLQSIFLLLRFWN